MATTAKAKPAKQKAAEDSLESVYEELVKILKRHAPPFRTDVPLIVRDQKAFQLTVPKPVAIPGAYGGRPVDLQMAAAILQEGYVGFYMMCFYLNDDTKKKLPPKLLKLLKGKTCFHLKNLDYAGILKPRWNWARNLTRSTVGCSESFFTPDRKRFPSVCGSATFSEEQRPNSGILMPPRDAKIS